MRVLLSLMKLDIGGAETHVVELAKELKRRGHDVFVTSNGGAYVEEIESFGIKHYLVPLQNKNPKNVMSAFKLLKKIIEDEKIDLVHSHARIPSFILGKLQKSMKFPFVTTAHGVFSTKYGLKYITDWGQKTLAVSEDIKKYLMDNYNIPESDITLTINGIDTEKFSPDKDKTLVLNEFGIDENDNLIVHVSRIDKEISNVAFSLIEAVEKLDSIIENLKLLIVGGGEDFEKLKEKADCLNEKLGRDAVILAGPRVDVHNILAPARLFVGVSRAALEAMAEEKPVILAGSQGYMGLFTEEKLDTALLNNFCGRGCDVVSTDKLSQDIGEFFGMWEEDIEKIGKFGRETVIKNYSVKKMADDNESVYKSVLEN